MKLLPALFTIFMSLQVADCLSEEALIDHATIVAPADMKMGRVQAVITILQSTGVDTFQLKADNEAVEMLVVLYSDVDPQRMDMLVLLDSLKNAGIKNVEVKTIPPKWTPYSTKGLEKAIAKKKGAIVLMRADWDAASVVLEKNTLTDPELEKELKRIDIPLFKADLTNLEGDAETLANAIKTKEVPALIVFPPDDPQSPLVYTGELTKELIEKLISDEFPGGTGSETEKHDKDSQEDDGR